MKNSIKIFKILFVLIMVIVVGGVLHYGYYTKQCEYVKFEEQTQIVLIYFASVYGKESKTYKDEVNKYVQIRNERIYYCSMYGSGTNPEMFDMLEEVVSGN